MANAKQFHARSFRSFLLLLMPYCTAHDVHNDTGT